MSLAIASIIDSSDVELEDVSGAPIPGKAAVEELLANGSIFGGSSDLPIAAFSGVSPNDGSFDPIYSPCVKIVLFWLFCSSLSLSLAACSVVAFSVPPISGVPSIGSGVEALTLLCTGGNLISGGFTRAGSSSSLSSLLAVESVWLDAAELFTISILASLVCVDCAASCRFSWIVWCEISSKLPSFSWLIDNAPSALACSLSELFLSAPGFFRSFASSIACGRSALASLSAIFIATSCWLAPIAIRFAATVITLDDVKLLLNLFVTATIPVNNAVAICSSSAALCVLRSLISSTIISLTPLALSSCQSTDPKPLLTPPAVIVTTIASCKIRPCAVKAASIRSLFSTFNATTSSTL